MQAKIVEATNGFNWGKFMVAKLSDRELATESAVDPGSNLFRSIGYNFQNIWVFDLQTREGAAFYPKGHARADLHKHKVWVCPMFEPFLEWLYTQDCSNISLLPALVELDPEATKHHTAMWGYRRPGVETFEEGSGI
jgi:hypothetical protein